MGSYQCEVKALGRLDSRVAIVTGCGRGFGRATAALFAREGATLSVCDVVPREELEDGVGSEIESLGGRAMCFQTDVSDEDQVASMVRDTIDELGTVDILVNNVGVSGPTKECMDITREEWEKIMSVNLGGMFLCTRAVLPEMVRRRWGRIINLSSISGKNPQPYRTPYATSKMGVIGFTRSLAAEVGRHNITVNAICPGFPGNERNVVVAKDLARHLGRPFDPEEYRLEMEEMRRVGVLGGCYLADEGFVGASINLDDVANMALFFASDEASRITGQDINVCGGSVMW
jgi:NAD(P)-dependent dehydrogenase (short-subunit alcohol dehydrogenase family)